MTPRLASLLGIPPSGMAVNALLVHTKVKLLPESGEGEVIITQDLYTYVFQGEDEHGKLIGEFKSSGLRPNFTKQAAYFGLDKALLELV